MLGKAGTGAVLSLDAVGMQDTYLTGTDDSFFQFKSKRHTPLTKYNSARTIENPGTVGFPFGQELKFQMNPRTMSDLLSNMYLKITLPPGNYCSEYLGWAMIDKIEFRIDSQVIETIQGDWNVVYSQLHYLIEEQNALKQLFAGPNLYIPLNFFFNRRHGTQDTGNPLIHDSYFKPYFLTCAAYGNREITVSVTFNPATFFTSDGICTLDRVTLVTEEIVLGPIERAFIQGNKQAQVISCVANNPVHVASSGSPFNVNLTPNVPVKALHWFFRDVTYENASDPTYFNDRYNFSSNVFTVGDETMSPIVGETQFYLNGQQVLGVSKSTSTNARPDGSYYYKFAQPLNHSLTVPAKNIYTYSFCIRPKDPAPSGAVNFSQLDSASTKLTGSFYAPGTFSINVFYTGYHEIIYENGFVSFKYAGV